MAGTKSPIRASTSSAAFAPAIFSLNVWVPWRRPPTRTLAPMTSSRLPMIEPVSDALTTSMRPACRAKNAMISSAMLPNVALRMPPTCGPVIAPSRSVERPTTQARPRIAGGRQHEEERRVGMEAEVEDDGQDAHRDGREQDDPADHRELSEDGKSGGPRRLRSPDDAICRDRRRTRSGAAGRSPRQRAGQPRLGRLRRPPAARPRRGRRRVASSAVTACAPGGRAPDQEPTTTANSPRGGIVPSAAAAASSPSEPRTIVSWTFVSSRQTAAGSLVTAGCSKVAERRRHPPRRLVHDRAALIRRDPLEAFAALATRPRQKTLERPAGTGQARRRDRRENSRCARDRHDHAALGSPGGDEVAARVADGRRPCIRDEGEVGTAAQVVEQRGRARSVALSVVARHPRLDAVAGKQTMGQTGVLGGDQRDVPQGLEGP